MITHSKLRELIDYDPETGRFRWRPSPRRSAVSGNVAGTINVRCGYRYIAHRRKLYLAHRLAWLYMTGRWPVNDIDHIDGNRDNNRWVNLRAATRAQNLRNSRVHKDNRSGLKGVSKHRKMWTARICLEGKTMRLGNFKTKEEAHAAYCRAAVEIGGTFARLN